jgi:hypothetical protein
MDGTRCENFCEDKNVHDALRLEELLDLPQNNGKTKFVEMRGWSANLYGPSTDPEITD